MRLGIFNPDQLDLQAPVYDGPAAMLEAHKERRPWTAKPKANSSTRRSK
jgi:hypothetical protein